MPPAVATVREESPAGTAPLPVADDCAAIFALNARIGRSLAADARPGNPRMLRFAWTAWSVTCVLWEATCCFSPVDTS